MPSQSNIVTICGRVQAIVYVKDDYAVFVFNVCQSADVKERVVRVRGHFQGISGLKAGVPLCIHGKWVQHPQYGRQVVATAWEPWAETDQDVITFLTVCIPGFLDLARPLTEKYSLSCIETLSQTPDRVLEDFRIWPRQQELNDALGSWLRYQTTRGLIAVLRSDGLSATLIREAMLAFGSDAGKIISENPYRLMQLPGMSFEKVDKISLGMGIPLFDPRRLGGAVLHVLRNEMSRGHLFVRKDDLSFDVAGLLKCRDMPDLELVYPDLSLVGAVTVAPGVGVYLSDLFMYEHESAQMLADNLAPVQLEVDVDAFLAEYERSNGIEFSEKQRDAVRLLPRNRVLVLTGGPGTGKTTALRALVHLFDTAHISSKLMAPTGIAAKRLATVSGHAATTIHRALKYDGSTWGHHSGNRLVTDAVIIDECSMLTQELLYRLLDALARDTILVFVGDDAQLPSVGPGSVLRELLSCPALSTVRLTQIFRQAESSAIVLNAHRINRGEMVVLDQPDSDFSFVPFQEEQQLAMFIVEMSAKLKARDANFQVISPKYDGPVGVNTLNDMLRDRLNPMMGQYEIQYGDFNLRVGDRVMIVQNDYKRNVYNGDVGKVVEIDRANIIVRIFESGANGDRLVQFSRDDLGKLRLAYAVTVHRMQGLEFETIIMPLVRSQAGMLQRNLFYTAVTRARQKCWVLGDASAVWQAIKNDKETRRNTRLSDIILELVGQIS